MYINAYSVFCSYFSKNWSLTPVSYLNAPTPRLLKSGDYMGCYVEISGTSSVTDRELNDAVVEEGFIRLDIHVPQNSTYEKSNSIIAEALKVFDIDFGGCSFWVEDVQVNAGYADDGTHVSRININYVTDYLFD